MPRIDTVDVCKIVRERLAEKWPGMIFSVRKDPSTYSSSIRVRWTDGPTVAQVEALVGDLHGEEFDGMTDSRSSNGRPYGNDFIFCERTTSAVLVRKAVKRIVEQYELDAPAIVEGHYTHINATLEQDTQAMQRTGLYWDQLLWRETKTMAGPLTQEKPARQPFSITTKTLTDGRRVLAHDDRPDWSYSYSYAQQAQARLDDLARRGIKARLLTSARSQRCWIEIL